MLIYILITLAFFGLIATWLFLTDPRMGPEVYLIGLFLWAFWTIPPMLSHKNKKK